MKMVGYVKWLENVMDNWVIKWQNEQNMWDFDKPFPLLQWFSVRLGMSQYSSLGMSQWIYTTPGAAKSVALMMKSPVAETPPGWEPGQVNRVVHCFPPLTLHSVVCVCVCVCVCENLPLTAVHVWDSTFHQATSLPCIYSGDIWEWKEVSERTSPLGG